MPRRYSPAARAAAWLVHAYTASGLVIAAAVATLVFGGAAPQVRLAFALMMLATAIDATDGWLARRLRVKQVVPGFDGRRLDDIVDYLNFTALPLLLLWRLGALGPLGWVLVAAAIASAYGFCQAEAKTQDGYFLGFPSYWNIVAFYLVALQVPAGLAAVLVTGLAALTFVPSRYLNTGQPGRLNAASNVLAALWVGLLLGALWEADQGDFSRPMARRLVCLSLFYPVYYFAASWAVTLGLIRPRTQPIPIRDAVLAPRPSAVRRLPRRLRDDREGRA